MSACYQCGAAAVRITVVEVLPDVDELRAEFCSWKCQRTYARGLEAAEHDSGTRPAGNCPSCEGTRLIPLATRASGETIIGRCERCTGPGVI